MNNSFVQGVSMVILMQHDLDAAVAFYNELGLKLQFRMKDKWAEFELNGVKIGLCPAAQPSQGHTGIVLHCNDLKATYESLKDSIVFLAEPVEATHGIMATIKDPGGNLLDLYQPTPEKLKESLQSTYEQAQGCCKGENDKSSCHKKKINSCC